MIIGATNNAFTANSPVAGIALVTNFFTITQPLTPPTFQSLNLSGTTLSITGSNGTPDAQYVVFASTNLALPLAQWTPLVTNAFDGSGNFSVSFGLTSTLEPQCCTAIFHPVTGDQSPARRCGAGVQPAGGAILHSGCGDHHHADKRGDHPLHDRWQHAEGQDHTVRFSTAPVTMPLAVDTDLTRRVSSPIVPV